MRANLYVRKLNRPDQVRQGDVIIAQPFHTNSYKHRAVVLIIESDSTGHTGVILNKLSTIRMNDALAATPLQDHVFFAGPCDLNLISFIHNNPAIESCIPIAQGLYWGGNFKQLEEARESNTMNAHDVRFLAGFMEWNAGELEDEILQKKWWISNINESDLLHAHPDRLWSNKLIKAGVLYGMLYEMEDPCMN